MSLWNRLHREDGATTVEYAVMLGLIIIVCLMAINSVGQSASNRWLYNQTQIEAQ